MTIQINWIIEPLNNAKVEYNAVREENPDFGFVYDGDYRYEDQLKEYLNPDGDSI